MSDKEKNAMPKFAEKIIRTFLKRVKEQQKRQ